MSVALRLLDDAAWVSVNDTREAGASELWPVVDGFCDCEPAWIVVENFVDVGVDGQRVDTRVVGHCVECGSEGTTDWLPVGRVVSGEYRPVAGIRRPVAGIRPTRQ